MGIQNIDTSRIHAGNNDRKRFDQAALSELAKSIDAHGLAQPITVRPDGDGFEIVAGERRFRAISTILRWDTIPAIVRDLDDETASAIMLAENTGREDLDPIEEARAYQSRIDTFGWTPEHVAEVAGVSDDIVRRRISLLSLTEDIQHLVSNGHLPIGHAEILTSLDSNRQRIAARIFSESDNMPFRIFRGVVNQLLEEQSQAGLFDLENFWVEQVRSNAAIPTRGKRAAVNVPTRSDLPKMKTTHKDNTSSAIKRYVEMLEDAGFADEAATVGTLYQSLVHLNFLTAVN